MKVQLKKGSTSNILQIFIADSSSTTGAGLTGLTQASSGLTAYYHRDTDTTATAITLVTMTVGTFTSSGFKEIDATNMPGWYQFCPPNAALASGASSCALHLKGATNMAPLPLEVELIAYDPQDTVRLGLTALPNAAAEAAGGLYTRGTGAGQINQPANGQIDANTVKVSGTSQTARDLGASVLISSGTGAGQLDVTSGVIKANLAQILGTALTETAGQIAAAFKQFFDVASPTGTMKAITNVVTATNLTNAPTSGDFTATMKTSLNAATPASVTGAVGSVTGNVGGNVVGSVGSVTAGVTLAASAVTAIWDKLTSALTTVGSIGKLLVDNINATVSSRASQTSVDTIDDFVDTEVAAIKAKTDNLPSDPADASDIAASFTTVNSKLDAIDDYIDTEVAAIKAKTDNLPASPAATSDIPSAATVADAVWDEAQSGHTTPGTFGKYLDTEVSGVSGGGGSSPTAAQIADAVWDEKVDDHMTDRSFGTKIGLYLPVVSPDIDYKRIRKIIDEVVTGQKPVEVDLEPISVALQSLFEEVRAIDIPKAEKVDFTPLMSKVSEVENAIKAIKIPETDLSPIEKHLDKQDKIIKPQVDEIKETLHLMLERVRQYFDGDMDAFKKEVASIKEVFESIPYVVMEVKDKPKPTKKDEPKSVLDEYLNL
jgi:hypothetical protein